ncbi:MAG: hypothetical protein LQ349_007129 [Xanthoria aureola]|nr:MAG: hypothetical protein LQ349_007129 [Xanthoria aureola]
MLAAMTKSSIPSLDGVAQELMDNIVDHLDLTSISSLRLACRRLGDRCCGQRYKSFFRQQALDLTPERLQRLCRIAAHPKLGSAVRVIEVTAVVYDTSELERLLSTKRQHIHEKRGVFSITTEPQVDRGELDEAESSFDRLVSRRREHEEMRRDESDVQLLADALRMLGMLDVLALEAAVDQGNHIQLIPTSTAPCEWHPIWIRASQVYGIVMSAIGRSQVRVDTLTIYKKSLRCSVPTFDVNKLLLVLRPTNFAAAAQHIRSLALSASTKVETDAQKVADARAGMSDVDDADSEDDTETYTGALSDDDPAAVAEDNYPAIAHLLKQMPNLETLHLHLYDTLKGSAKSYVKVFSYIADDVVLASLRQLTIRGFYCDESSLLKFLGAHENLGRLELYDIDLTSGSWSPILEYLTTMRSLQHVALHNLWRPGRGMLNLAPRDLSKSEWKGDLDSWFPCLDGTMVHSRVFSQKDIQTERFDFAGGPNERQSGSPQFYRWITARRAQCGPP